MSNSTEVTTNRAITVPFHGVELYVVEHNGQPYTPMRPVVEGMKLTWPSQYRKLAANRARWGVAEIATPVSDSETPKGGVQQMLAMPLRKLPGWLANIESGKVKDAEARAKVIQYQNECDDALWKYWNEGVAVNARAAQPVQAALDYDRISPAQAQDLKQIVQAIVDAGLQNYAETWKRLQNKFKVNSYLALRPDQYEAARTYLLAKLPNGYSSAIEGEVHAPQPSAGDIDLAFSLATQAAAQVQRAVFNSVMSGNEGWKRSRYLLNLDAEDKEAVIHAKQIDTDIWVLPINRLNEAVEESLSMDAQTLTQLASTCTAKLGRMAQLATDSAPKLIGTAA